ncbi:MAG: M20/M25/M40 family metallo-hydrolase [Bacteroidetes bacterium]|nr:M20/M25/M40 family metallo-hydrolase [Bacteroidota bacterium]
MTFNYQEYFGRLETLIANYGAINNISGLKQNLKIITERLKNLNFEIEVYSDDSNSDIIVAKRKPIGSNNWLGFYAHYDVETIESEGWKTDPKKLTEIDDRLFGRGIADNLGIILIRLMALESLSKEASCPGLIWVFQGEEEIGSPYAHKVFPTIKIPEVNLWMEETGYFDLTSSRQRFLTLNEDDDVVGLKPLLENQLNDIGFTTYTENRSLTKFDKCPFLSHLLGSKPYLGLGPNDEYSNIHKPNESLSKITIEINFRQTKTLIQYYAN